MTIGGAGLCLKRCVIWTTICVTTFMTTINLQRKVDIDLETKKIEWES